MNVITNLKNWNWRTHPKYSMEKREADELITSFQKEQPVVVEDHTHYFVCPICKNDVNSGSNYCPKCGQKLIFKHRAAL